MSFADLSGRVALVTGAGSADGIGFAAARGLGGRGAAVAITATSERIADRERELRDAGVDAWSTVADLTDPAAAERLVDGVRTRYGRLDVLVNNAGMTQTGASDAASGTPFGTVTPQAWQEALDRTLTTAVNTTRAALAHLTRGGGRVIFVSSVTGSVVAIPGDAVYAAAKAGMDGLMRALALEAGPDGITVNAVQPGWIATASATSAEREAGRHTPVGRPGTPDEVAAAIVFLAAPESAYVTGATLVVDGGNTIQEIKRA